MTTEGAFLFIISIVLVPLITGQLRRFVKVDGKMAAILALVISTIVAGGVLLFYGQLKLSTDPQALGADAALVFGLATLGYKLLYGAFSPSLQAKLIGSASALRLSATLARSRRR